MHDDGTDAAPTRQGLRAFRPASPVFALGLAVNHLMAKPAFAALRFGAWSKILVGQINRGHYRFVVDDGKRVVGLLGWTLADAEAAEAWITGRATAAAGPEDSACIIFNVWSADTAAAGTALLDAAREAMQGREMAYFKRFYADGRIRPVRLRVNPFVQRHIERRRSMA